MSNTIITPAGPMDIDRAKELKEKAFNLAIKYFLMANCLHELLKNVDSEFNEKDK